MGIIIKASAATTATESSDALHAPAGTKGVAIFVDVTAVGGTPTLDITVDRFDVASNAWLAIVGGALAQITTAVGQIDLVIYPGIGERDLGLIVGTPLSVLTADVAPDLSASYCIALYSMNF